MLISIQEYTINNSSMFMGGFMQVIDISSELRGAIDSIEKMLNGEDGEKILDSIRRYKASKQSFDTYSFKQIRK